MAYPYVDRNPAPIIAVVDSRIRIARGLLPKALATALKAAFTHPNPDYHKKKALGFALFGVDVSIKTYRETETHLELPRGATKTLRKLVVAHGLRLSFVDQRVVRPPVAWPDALPTSVGRSYQLTSIDKALEREQGIVRMPTGSGKTWAALEFLRRLGQPALVIMRDRNLMAQWKERAVSQLGLKKAEIGELRGGAKLRIGARLTLALQQTLYSKSFPLETVAHEFGVVVVDEVHGVAAKTFQDVIDVFPAKYRVGYSADETRKDKREFLVYDQFGEVIHEVERHELESAGVIHRVTVRLVPTDFEADWYRDASSGERDFNRLLNELTTDEVRNEQLLDLIRDIVKRDEKPVFVFTHRIEHARWLSDVGVFSRGITCGLMLGGADNAVRFNEDKARLAAGTLDVAAGTFAAIGQGIDVPHVEAGIMATPIGNNRQFFNQVRGRVCRTSPGKKRATLYLMWDRRVFPDAPKTYASWNGGDVEVWDAEHEVWRDATRRR